MLRPHLQTLLLHLRRVLSGEVQPPVCADWRLSHAIWTRPDLTSPDHLADDLILRALFWPPAERTKENYASEESLTVMFHLLWLSHYTSFIAIAESFQVSDYMHSKKKKNLTMQNVQRECCCHTHPCMMWQIFTTVQAYSITIAVLILSCNSSTKN